MRSGTVPTPLVVGLGAACELANREMEYDHQHVQRLSDMLVEVIGVFDCQFFNMAYVL